MTTSNLDVPAAFSSRRSIDWHLLAVLSIGVVGLLSRFLRGNAFAFYEDDFFYYTQVARNLVLHGVSSFDGNHLTNGYHPLWFLTIALVYKLVPAAACLVAIQVVSVVLLLAFYIAAVRCFEGLGVASPLRRSAALLLSLQALLLYRYGMEIIISLPIGMAMLAYILSPRYRWSDAQSVCYGLLASLTVLGRLDSILLVALLIVGQTLLLPATVPVRFRRLAFFSLGLLPLALYVLINYHWFHTLLPVSGSAKELKPWFPPSTIPIKSVFLPVDRMKAVFILPSMLLYCAGVVRLWANWANIPQNLRIIYLALFGFPVLQLGTLSFVSDWTTWPWYFYIFCYSSLAALSLLLPAPVPQTAVHRSNRIVTFASSLYVLYIAIYAIKKAPDPIAMLGGKAADFARAHPGIYAMGDEAGAPAYFSGQPFVQLEGLTMDAAYLDFLRQKPTLPAILSRYHVQFFVAMAKPTIVNGCYLFAEPGQAGPQSLHSAGRVCTQPIYQTTNSSGASIVVFNASDMQ